MGIACHKQLRKIRYFSLGVYVYYILKPKKIHLLPQSKLCLLVPESLRKLHKEKSKMQQCIKILLLHIYLKLNMFRATHRLSSGA